MRAVNLLPRDESRRKSSGLSIQTQLMTIAPVFAAAALAAAWYVTDTQVKDRRTTLKALQGELAQLPEPKQQALPD